MIYHSSERWTCWRNQSLAFLFYSMPKRLNNARSSLCSLQKVCLFLSANAGCISNSTYLDSRELLLSKASENVLCWLWVCNVMGTTLNGWFPRCQYTSIFSLMNFPCVINDLHISALVLLKKKVHRATREHSMSFIRMAIHTRACVPAHKYVYTCDALVNVCFGFHTITRNTSTNLYLTL